MAYNILIVDDSITTRAVIAKTIDISGIEINEIYEASNGKEALDILNDNWIDIILTDINMPIMGGVEFIEKLLSNGILQSIPVIIISTEGNATRIESLKSKGISAYIRKPFLPEVVGHVICDLLGEKNE